MSDVKIIIEVESNEKVKEIANEYQLNVNIENDKAQLKLFYTNKVDIDNLDKYDGYNIIKEGNVLIKLLKELEGMNIKINVEADGCGFTKLLGEICLFLSFGI